MLQLLIGIAYAQSQCLSLKGSKACPEFAAYGVYRGSGSPSFNSVDEFDKFISAKQLNNIAGLESFKKDQSCPYMRETIEIPFLESTWCAAMVDMSQKTFGCNSNQPIKQICKRSATVVGVALRRIFGDHAKCIAGASRKAYSDLITFVEKFVSNENDCIVSQGAERYCGFASLDVAHLQCKSRPTASCCSTLPANQPATVTKADAAPSPAATIQPAATSSIPHPTSSHAVSTAANAVADPLITINPVMLAASVCGLALIALLVFALIFACRRRKSNRIRQAVESASAGVNVFAGQKSIGSVIPIADTMRVTFAYKANLSDELTLNLDDKILVQNRFDDGWGFGLNLDTNQEGSFPLSCVGQLLNRDSSEFSISDEGISTASPKDSWRISRRSSLRN